MAIVLKLNNCMHSGVELKTTATHFPSNSQNQLISIGTAPKLKTPCEADVPWNSWLDCSCQAKRLISTLQTTSSCQSLATKDIRLESFFYCSSTSITVENCDKRQTRSWDAALIFIKCTVKDPSTEKVNRVHIICFSQNDCSWITFQAWRKSLTLSERTKGKMKVYRYLRCCHFAQRPLERVNALLPPFNFYTRCLCHQAWRCNL